MEGDAAKRERHSENWFGDARDHWWHRDFLALVARRWDLGEMRHVLDVGCGIGHWGRALLPHLASTTTLSGIDCEPDWVVEATARARAHGLAGRVTYLQGTVEALPFEDATFDLVTCQTVIMHLADPLVGLREMLRVLAPGGRILVAEPNNRATAMAVIDPELSIEDQLGLLELELRGQRGKQRLGEGDNSIGERVPGLFATLGLSDIQVLQNDKSGPFVPPYASDDEQARIDNNRELVDRRLWIADEAGSRRYWLAGGGSEADFPQRWELMMRAHRLRYEALVAGTYASAGGALFYLVTGKKA